MCVQVRGGVIGEKFRLSEKISFPHGKLLEESEISEVLHGFFNSGYCQPKLLVCHSQHIEGIISILTLVTILFLFNEN